MVVEDKDTYHLGLKNILMIFVKNFPKFPGFKSNLFHSIWWGKAPRIINTFLEQYNLKGKTIIPFCTSGGSGIEGAMKLIKASAPTANWKNGKLLNGNPSETELKSWAKTIK